MRVDASIMPDRSSIKGMDGTGRAAAAATGTAVVAPPGTVLVVDPDGGVREEIAAWLRGAGYVTVESDRFDDARQVLAARPFDVLVVGLRLGAFNGLHLVITARATHPALRAVLTTSAEDRGLGDEARQADAVCLVKPVGREALLAAVARGHNS